MASANDKEIIDLTVSSPTPQPILIVDDEDIEVNHALPTTNSSRKDSVLDKKTKRGKKKNRKSVILDLEEGEVMDTSANVSREQSPSRRPNGGSASDRNGDRERNNVDGGVCSIDDLDDGEGRGGRKGRRHRRSRTPPPRRRSHSPGRQRRPPDDGSDLFFIDEKPAPVAGLAAPVIVATNIKTTDTTANEGSKLLLPAHVSVFGAGANGLGPVEILPPSNPVSDEEDYIEYLDTDDRKAPGVIRYFDDDEDEQTQSTKATKFLCKNCGDEGSHRTWECPVNICLTCGARDEHSTRSCPISKTCYTCGMRGHINRTCPNRYGGTDDVGNYNDCARCGSSIHKAVECPTLWRLYEYLTDEEREQTLRRREGKRHLDVGNGGEGYIATDVWCYNCGVSGHWGDNCDDMSHPSGFPREPSAFSLHNMMSGPFYDPANEPDPSVSRYREHGSWIDDDSREQVDPLPDDWGQNAPTNVGKKGKKKDKAKMEQRWKEEEEEDDPDDWFGNPRNARSRGIALNASAKGGKASHPVPKKMSFGFSEGRQFQPPTALPRGHLLDRLTDAPRHPNSDGDRRLPAAPRGYRAQGASKVKQSRDYDHADRHRVGGHRDRERERDRDRRHRDSDRWDRREEGREAGPRYRGGYSR